ncbi:MAG: hypothetical protein JXM70_15910 [Pirellulales bacterium]|nr:hypothetical protein [Pirellulales bacterium]
MRPRFGYVGVLLMVSVVLCGCGTTRQTDTSRTATEQLLITDAMDRAVSRVDFRALSGRNVYLDSAPATSATDHAYLVSSLRQHMLSSGCILRDARDKADCIVELRVGAVGTDTHNLTLGVPAVNVPSAIAVTGAPASIPEIPFAKKTEQRAVTKMALFAYDCKTGRPIWQSGILPTESTAKDTWLFGMGPFRRGTIYKGTQLAGDQFVIPIIVPGEDKDGNIGSVAVADEVFFANPKESADEKDKPADKTEDKSKDVAEAKPAKEPAKEQKKEVAKAEKPKPEAEKATPKATAKADPETEGKIIAVAHTEPVVTAKADDSKNSEKPDGKNQLSSLTAPWPFRDGESMPPRRLPTTVARPLGSVSEAMKAKLTDGLMLTR